MPPPPSGVRPMVSQTVAAAIKDLACVARRFSCWCDGSDRVCIVAKLRKQAAKRQGTAGFSDVSLLGSSQLWGSLSWLPRFLGTLNLLKNRQAMEDMKDLTLCQQINLRALEPVSIFTPMLLILLPVCVIC